MSTPILQLIDAALAGDLTKNELKAFLALVRQTLCFGKTSDPLTLKRLATLTQVRKDRLELAIASILQKGLFTRVTHPIFEHEYHVHPQFLPKDAPLFFAPKLPKNGETFRESDDFSEKRIHTIQTNTNLKPTHKQEPVPVCAVFTPSAQELTKPSAVHQQAFNELLPALKKLPTAHANDVLALLNLAIQDGSIRTTQQRLGGALIKAAKAGTLDTSTLISLQPTEAPPKPIDHCYRQDLISKIHGLEGLKQLAGILDPHSEQQLHTWRQELKQLQTTPKPENPHAR